MKILMLSWEYPPRIVGGISRVVHDLSHKLIDNGHEVTVITYRDGDMSYFEDDGGVKVHRVDNFMINPNNFIDWIMQLNFAMTSKAIELINNGEKFDLIHAHDWLVAYSSKTIKEAYKIPLIASIHATESGRNSGIHNEAQRYVNDTEWMLTYEASEVIVNSNFMKSELNRLFGLPDEKVGVIPNGVNLKKFERKEVDINFRRQYAMDNEKIILHVGRIVYEKGSKYLVNAMPKIIANYNDVKLVICGSGPMLEELKNNAKAMGISEKIYFAGYCDSKKLEKIYSCADIAVFPSTYEPFGIVALESMLSGVPTVVSDVGGLKEIIDHSINGMKAYPGNSNSIADSVIELLKNSELANKISKNAVQKVKENYNWALIVDKTEEVYEKALNKAEKNAKLEKELLDIPEKRTKSQIIKKEITNILSFGKKNVALNI